MNSTHASGGIQLVEDHMETPSRDEQDAAPQTVQVSEDD
jgi:hypothetical protein